MEFIMQTDLEQALPKVIDFNHEALKAELEERLHHYNGLIVTEDAIKDAKDDRAKLNKLREALENKRKEVKKQCLAPYTEFEVKVKELVALVDQPIVAIDTQLKAYDEERRKKKRAQIAIAYAGIIPDEIKDIVPLETIFSPKWENETVSMKKVEEELAALAKRTSADMFALNTVEAEYSTAVREVYMRTLDIEKAMAHKASLVAAAEAFKQVAASVPTPEPKPQAEAAVEPVATAEPPQVEPAQAEPLYTLRLAFELTKSQAAALKSFLVANGIKHTKI